MNAIQKRRVMELALKELGKQPIHDSLLRRIVGVVVDAVEAENSERLQALKARRRAERRFLGGAKPPFGFRLGDDGRLVRCPQQQVWVRKIPRMAEQGKSLRSIAGEIQAAGFPISHVGVSNILKVSTMRSIQGVSKNG
jgi:hypothetical protein